MAIKNRVLLLEEKAELIRRRLSKCDICPRNCRVNRLKNEKGYCQAQENAVVYSAFLHHGEEPAISGSRGSGTIFFSGCNLKCIYCQNYKFSHYLKGTILPCEKLGKVMLNLQNQGAHNINLVTPTHFLPQILGALLAAAKGGFDIPLVYNTSGFEKKEIITLINGIIDIYLVDLKYLYSSSGEKYSKAKDYPHFASESIKEMYRQVKNAKWDKGLLKKGLVIRHLVLPGLVAESKKILNWIKKNTPEAFVSVMFQYQPYFKANTCLNINRRIELSEYREIKALSGKLKLKGWVQNFTSREELAGVYFKPKLEI